MIRRPPRSTLDRSSAASDVYKRQGWYIDKIIMCIRFSVGQCHWQRIIGHVGIRHHISVIAGIKILEGDESRILILHQYIMPDRNCLLYTSDAADERSSVDLGGRRIIKKKNYKDHTATEVT